jgi:hypothetical protein
MRSVLRLTRISVLFAASLCMLLPPAAPAQDASGRPSVVQDPSGRPKPRRTGRPKKVIRARPATDVERVPTASVIIRSYPPDAEVFLDGQLVGTTADDGELELSDLRLGQHRVVLKKDGYLEWAQTVTLTAGVAAEVEPLLQSENAYFRDVAKLPAVEFGREVTGRLSRDSVAARDGKTFYNEYVMRVAEPDAYVFVLAPRGSSPTLKLVDDSNISYSIEPLGNNVYQSVVVPRPGYYYLQVAAAIDESTFTGGEYSLKVIEERVARAERPVSVGDTVKGSLDASDRLAGPGDYYDSYSLAGQSGATVRIAALADGAFTPGLTLLLDGKVVATSGRDDGKKKKKKDAPAATGGAEITTTLTGGTYTIYVRSLAGAKVGSYQLSVTSGG